jgi:hypothetical protein
MRLIGLYFSSTPDNTGGRSVSDSKGPPPHTISGFPDCPSIAIVVSTTIHWLKVVVTDHGNPRLCRETRQDQLETLRVSASRNSRGEKQKENAK